MPNNIKLLGSGVVVVEGAKVGTFAAPPLRIEASPNTYTLESVFIHQISLV